MRNQRVSYRTVSDVFIKTAFSSPASIGTIFAALLEHIDIKDNCVQVKWTEILDQTGVDKGNASRALSRLKEDGLVKYVLDIRGDERIMINPQHVWSTSRDELRFAVLMFDYGSHQLAVEHRRVERELSATIDHKTGLMASDYQVGLQRLCELQEAYEKMLGK